ncbi:hypothetical protein Tco_1275835 [Tanacetum coccineum]
MRQQKSYDSSNTQKVRTVTEVQGNLSQEGRNAHTYEDDPLSAQDIVRKKFLFTLRDPALSQPRTRMPSHVKTLRQSRDPLGRDVVREMTNSLILQGEVFCSNSVTFEGKHLHHGKPSEGGEQEPTCQERLSKISKDAVSKAPQVIGNKRFRPPLTISDSAERPIWPLGKQSKALTGLKASQEKADVCTQLPSTEMHQLRGQKQNGKISKKHPQANGPSKKEQIEVFREVIKAKLDERSRDWIEELPQRPMGAHLIQ